MDEEKRSSSDLCAVGSHYLSVLIGNQLRERLQQWLSPPDPSINHNIARKVHHEGTATWFFQGSIFNEWKSSPSLLWVHGKRTSFLPLLLFPLVLYSCLGSGIRQECPVVCHFSPLQPALAHTTTVPALSKILWCNARQEWRPWLIFIAIFATKTSKTVATSSFPSFRNFGISPIFVAIFLPTFIWHMTKANENPVMTL